MKKIVAMLLVLVMMLSMTACGKKGAYAGVYEAVSATAEGIDTDCRGDWLELKASGKGKLCLMGETFSCKWELDGEDFVLENRGDEFSGTLHNGVITLDYGDMTYIYVMPPVENKRGEVKGHVHDWLDADCENGEICADCGAEEGKPLGHVALPANYQEPSVCKRCGNTVEEVLQPAMEKYGITEFMELGVTYEYTTITKNKSDVTTTGELTVTDYDIFTSGEGYPEKEGYEWRVIKGTVVFFDKNANNYGSITNYCYEDYYDIDLYDDDAHYEYDEETEIFTRMISYHGEEYLCYGKEIWKAEKWKYNSEAKRRQTIGNFERAWQVPVGYDGIVAGFYNDHAVEWNDQHIYEIYDPEQFWLFRLN